MTMCFLIDDAQKFNYLLLQLLYANKIMGFINSFFGTEY